MRDILNEWGSKSPVSVRDTSGFGKNTLAQENPDLFDIRQRQSFLEGMAVFSLQYLKKMFF